jgi:hypothetical protein
MESPSLDLRAAHRHFSTACFNSAWELIDKTPRSHDEDMRMVLTSMASLWHWTKREDCTDMNLAAGYWQASRVFALVGQGQVARWFATACLEASDDEVPFSVGYAHEAAARAELLLGRADLAREHIAEARTRADLIDDDESRSMLLSDLESIEIG